uniref:Ribosomal protein S16 n=1 Tax=Paravannella minima TaxID=1443144 RepID=A0A411K7J7_9EUKA|nr:ribosomal protein S16 [Paravannella minima]QBC73418.1 ribosomal protein S16 [Paravannella minima]
MSFKLCLLRKGKKKKPIFNIITKKKYKFFEKLGTYIPYDKTKKKINLNFLKIKYNLSKNLSLKNSKIKKYIYPYINKSIINKND